MAVQDPAAKAAIQVYSSIHQSLLRDARLAESDRKPLTARTLRFKASLVARAALIEELDPEPRGLPRNAA